MKIFTYWEQSKFSEAPPPYILCGLVSMMHALGDEFLLLGRRNLHEHIDFDFATKKFYFAGTADKKFNDISSITAKCDFIRFKYVLENGGIWIDADTIVLRSFSSALLAIMDEGKLAWHSEQIFGAHPGNAVVAQVVENMLLADRQLFANPGNVQEVTKAARSQIEYIPITIMDPTANQSYTAKNWDLILADIKGSDFIRNPDCSLIKMYNSVLSQSILGGMSVSEFLGTKTLLASIFLWIKDDKDFWIDESAKLLQRLLSERD